MKKNVEEKIYILNLNTKVYILERESNQLLLMIDMWTVNSIMKMIYISRSEIGLDMNRLPCYQISTMIFAINRISVHNSLGNLTVLKTALIYIALSLF